MTVSLLHGHVDLGAVDPREVPRYVRHGQQALAVAQGERSGLLLPSVASTQPRRGRCLLRVPFCFRSCRSDPIYPACAEFDNLPSIGRECLWNPI